ncbi:SMP-30/gluconolactonase/LRE family protein, partial [Planctomycetota bacterium]
QTIVWNGKDDRGRYVDDKDRVIIRVSLGLKPRYEKSLFWDPRKRVSRGGPGEAWTEDIMAAPRPEGVYVFDGNGVDHIQLFDHEGNYIRTVYPFPAAKLKDVKGLEWKDYPHGYSRPQKNGLNRTTFFKSGGVNGKQFALASALAFAVHGKKIAMVFKSLSRLSTDGSSEGMNIHGPKAWFDVNPRKPWDGKPWNEQRACPYSAAFSPDGKRLYLAGYSCTVKRYGKRWLDGVAVMDYKGDTKPRIFAGTMKVDTGLKTGVACDADGNVYVTDYVNDCIRVYSPEAKELKTISIMKPVLISVNPKTGELYVFSWNLNGRMIWAHPKMMAFLGGKKGIDNFSKKTLPTLTIIKSAEEPKSRKKYSMPWVIRGSGWTDRMYGTEIRASVDFYTTPATIWLTPTGGVRFRTGDKGRVDVTDTRGWDSASLLLLQVKGSKLTIKRSFGEDVSKAIKRVQNKAGHQRLYVNPANERLYLTENEYWVGGGSFYNLIEVDPETGKVREIRHPLSMSEDMTFDIDGRAYLRQKKPQRVVRLDSNTWREIPWDYGEEGINAKDKIIAALPLPAWTTVCYSEGGLSISPKGHLAVSCSTKDLSKEMAHLQRIGNVTPAGKAYQPRIYPGRKMTSVTACVHVWDKHGKLLIEDAVPGMSQIDGIGIDKDDNLYVMSAGIRVWNGKKHFNLVSGTLIKVKPRKNKWLSSSGKASLPLLDANRPKRAPDINAYGQRDLWVEGAEWFYGGVGNCSFKIATGCICWQQSRFTLDYFARSFVPENDQFSVAVLDTNGNLIMRIGKYGNVDDGMPLILTRKSEVGSRNEKEGSKTTPRSAFRVPPSEPMLVPPNPRPLGGDEVALMHPSHVATMTDRYLYIGDVGNARVVQVKL